MTLSRTSGNLRVLSVSNLGYLAHQYWLGSPGLDVLEHRGSGGDSPLRTLWILSFLLGRPSKLSPPSFESSWDSCASRGKPFSDLSLNCTSDGRFRLPAEQIIVCSVVDLTDNASCIREAWGNSRQSTSERGLERVWRLTQGGKHGWWLARADQTATRSLACKDTRGNTDFSTAQSSLSNPEKNVDRDLRDTGHSRGLTLD